MRDNAASLNWPENVGDGFDGMVLAPDRQGRRRSTSIRLRLTVVGPDASKELDELRKEWVKETKKLKKATPAEAAEVAEYLDESVYNLSSIVCVAELGGARMLLTGDARGDNVLQGLEAAKFLEPGRQDGGSGSAQGPPPRQRPQPRAPTFFERLPARHLVISANGKDGNPDLETLEMISAARREDRVHNPPDRKRVQRGDGPEDQGLLREGASEAGCRYDVSFRPAGELSLRVDLLDRPA